MGKLSDQFKGLKKDTIARNSRRSSKWFVNKLKSKNIDKRLIVRKPILGKMYTYQYNPKHKDTLPYYDINPLVIPIAFYPDGYLGLNLHYLPPKLRLLFLDKLMDFTSGNKPNRKKFKLTYDLLRGTSRLKAFQPTLHRYLYSQLKTPLVTVEADEWEFVVMLPLARFKKKSNSAVYTQSRKMI